jgi:hypothetical protein
VSCTTDSYRSSTLPPDTVAPLLSDILTHYMTDCAVLQAPDVEADSSSAYSSSQQQQDKPGARILEQSVAQIASAARPALTCTLWPLLVRRGCNLVMVHIKQYIIKYIQLLMLLLLLFVVRTLPTSAGTSTATATAKDAMIT